jgi:hypothetical protein
MKINRAIIFNIFFSVGASLPPRLHTITEDDWVAAAPPILTSENAVWVADKDYTWVKSKEFYVGPARIPHFKIMGTAGKNQFSIENISDVQRHCVIKRLDNLDFPWLEFLSFPFDIHWVIASPVTIYYRK